MTKARLRALIVSIGPGVIIFSLMHLASVMPVERLNCWVATTIAQSNPPTCSGSLVATPTFLAFFGAYALLAVVLSFVAFPRRKEEAGG